MTSPAKAQSKHSDPPPSVPSTPITNPAGSPDILNPYQGALSESGIAVPSAPAWDSGLSVAESCNAWTEAGFHSPTVSAARLMVPNKASSEYQKACGALKDRKLEQASEHVHKALDIYANYAAAWVLLGQILEGQQKRADARQACSHAMSVDSEYVAPYLCLADFAAKEGDWDQVSVLADRARALDPVSDAFTFYFTAGVQFHFQQLRQAEMNAETALKLDMWHRVPELHYLMAQICQARGDLRNEAIQLREYLKVSPNAPNAADARTLLAQIDTTKLPK